MLSSLALEVTICEFYTYKSAAGLVSSAMVLTEELYFNGVRRAIVGTHKSLFGVCAGIASCCMWQVASYLWFWSCGMSQHPSPSMAEGNVAK